MKCKSGGKCVAEIRGVVVLKWEAKEIAAIFRGHRFGAIMQSLKLDPI